jgi:hypothetical protein
VNVSCMYNNVNAGTAWHRSSPGVARVGNFRHGPATRENQEEAP